MLSNDVWELIFSFNTYLLVFSGTYLCIATPLYIAGIFFPQLWKKILGIPHFAWMGVIMSSLFIITQITILNPHR